MTFLFIAFAAGILTVLAPCILPLLPAIIGGSVSGDRDLRRASIITLSLGVSVVVFTLVLKASTAFITIPPLFWKLLSGGLLLAFGCVTLFPALWEHLRFTNALLRTGNRAVAIGDRKKSIWGDIIVGAALGPVFTSCSPTYFIVLATVLPAHPLEGFLYLLAYAAGLSLSLLALSIVGQRLADRLGASSDPRGILKRSIGALFIVLGLAVVTGWDVRLAASLPPSAYGISGIEQKLLSLTTTDSLPLVAQATTSTQCTGGTCALAGTTAPAVGTPLIQAELARKAALFPRAPELVSPDGYLNTDGQPITISQFKGKSVVLIDFWTYSCINCQRTIPYVKAWYSKYKDQGLVIIGVHTPEFAFEGVQANVADALKRFGITYPVVMDSKYLTWNAFGNQYWPRKYLIDIDGYIVYDHAGEGEYDRAEDAITTALAERAMRLHTAFAATNTIATPPAPDLSHVGSPETYFGSSRNEYLGEGVRGQSGIQTLAVPPQPALNTLYLGGVWDVQPEYAQSQGVSSVTYRFDAQDVYFVASADSDLSLDVMQDGKLLTENRGADVDASGVVQIGTSRLYHLIHNPKSGTHTLELHTKKGGLKAFTFTFG